eukprot:8121387-Prorocentrum_lima.AAC.1
MEAIPISRGIHWFPRSTQTPGRGLWGQAFQEWQKTPFGTCETLVNTTNHAKSGQACVYARTNSTNR